jgi:nitrite reductase/ring-hydroxylating ferredoxin subunit
VTTAPDGSGPYAMADRCSHRGGPLSEGELQADCVVCPWHGSRFDVRDGHVRRGPASVPQPIYEVRTGEEDAIEVRRTEHRALRRNAV